MIFCAALILSRRSLQSLLVNVWYSGWSARACAARSRSNFASAFLTSAVVLSSLCLSGLVRPVREQKHLAFERVELEAIAQVLTGLADLSLRRHWMWTAVLGVAIHLHGEWLQPAADVDPHMRSKSPRHGHLATFFWRPKVLRHAATKAHGARSTPQIASSVWSTS